MRLILNILLFGLISQASAQYISFAYDDAGNRIKREFVLNGTFRKGTVDSTAINDQIGTDKFQIFPNPTTSLIHIEMANKEVQEEREYSISNLGGITLFTKSSKEAKLSFDFSTQPAGLYLLKIKSKDDEVVWRIVKQ